MREAEAAARAGGRAATCRRAAGACPAPRAPAPPFDLGQLAALVESLRGVVPPELSRQLAEALRELLLALRAVLDWYIARLEPASRPRRTCRTSRSNERLAAVASALARLRELPPELRNAGIAAGALVLSMLLPWYEQSYVPEGSRVMSPAVSGPAPSGWWFVSVIQTSAVCSARWRRGASVRLPEIVAVRGDRSRTSVSVWIALRCHSGKNAR